MKRILVYLFGLSFLFLGMTVVFAQEEGGKPVPVSQQTQDCLGCHREVVNQ